MKFDQHKMTIHEITDETDKMRIYSLTTRWEYEVNWEKKVEEKKVGREVKARENYAREMRAIGKCQNGKEQPTSTTWLEMARAVKWLWELEIVWEFLSDLLE